MANDFIVNPDGSLTKKGSSPLNSNSPGGSSDNRGCVWAVILAICIIVGIIFVANNNSSNNNSYSEPEKDVSEAVSNNNFEEEETYVEETSNEVTYLSVSESHVTFDSDGGSIDIYISTDGVWEIGAPTADWGHLSKHSSYVTLRVGSYSGDDDRTDWFTIKAGDYEERINITQQPKWMECGKCRGRGYTSCSYCNNGYRSCSHCNNGYKTCTNSNYTGVVDNIGQYGHGKNVPIYTYDQWTGMQMIAGYRLEVCPTCGGTYRLQCSYCNGSGKSECSYCDGEGKSECSSCDGTGKVRN